MNRNLVTIDDFTEYLSVFQRIIYLLAEEKGYEDIKDFRFLIKSIKLDSYDCLIESYSISKDLVGESIVERVINEFEEISVLVDKKEREDAYSRLIDKIRSQDKRITLYNYYDRIIPKENNAFQIYIGKKEDPKSRRIFMSKKQQRKNINTWREMDKKPERESKTIIGVIKNLNAIRENKKFVNIIDQEGNKIHYYYKKDEREKIIKFYDSNIIKITGEYDPHQKTLYNLMEIKKMDSVELFKLNDLKFKQPIKLELEYKHGSLFGSNKEFGLFASGSSYNDMLDDLYIRIIDILEMYSNSEIKFTKKSKEYRMKFLENFYKNMN
ncbi:MAG: hypothetical protein ACFFDH_03320 [Promethearchaeota archaeon]